MGVVIERLTEATPNALADINRLIDQLREDGGVSAGAIADLESIVGNKSCVMVVARDGEKIVGTATLYMFTKIGKRVAYVEDVVVDSAYRGQGLGEGLMCALIQAARSEGLHSLSLTSRPARAAANALYQKLGFELKETNAYRLRLS